MADIDRIVERTDKLAVVGWSTDRSSYSNDVATYLADHDLDVVPVNPKYAGQKVYGHKVVKSIQEANADGDVDVVLVFRKPEDVTEHVDDAIAAEVPVFWMQLGITNEEAAKRLRAEDIEVVQDTCFKVEHGRVMRAEA